MNRPDLEIDAGGRRCQRERGEAHLAKKEVVAVDRVATASSEVEEIRMRVHRIIAADVQVAIAVQVILAAGAGGDEVEWRRWRDANQVAEQAARRAFEEAEDVVDPIIVGICILTLNVDEQVQQDGVAGIADREIASARAMDAEVKGVSGRL